MIAKVIVWDEKTHDGAVDKMLDTLRLSKVQGCPTNFQYLSATVSYTHLTLPTKRIV